MTFPDPATTARSSEGTGQTTLSTGRTTPLPLDCEAEVAGAAVAVPVDRVGGAIPDELAPLRIAPETGVAILASVCYRRVGDLDPYREFAVVVPVADADRSPVTAPFSAGGYVAYLPVTTDESVALGREVWGYPKERAAIDVDDRGRIRETTVVRDGKRVISIAVRRPRALLPIRATVDSYTDPGGVLEVPVGLRGRAGVGNGGVALELGEGDRAEDLRGLGLDDATPLGRFWSPELTARIYRGEWVEETADD